MLAGLLQFVLVTPADDRDGARFSKLVRRCQANAGGAAGNQDHLAAHGTAQRTVDVQVRIKMAFPVIPQPPGVVLEVRTGDARTFERRQRIATIETRRIVDKSQHVLRQAQVRHDRVAHPAHRRQRHQAFGDTARNESKQGGVDKEVHFGRVRRTAEDVEHIANAVSHGIDQVIALLVNTCLVADGIERVHHKIDRHDIDAPALQPD